jgi:hypothetical protein
MSERGVRPRLLAGIRRILYKAIRRREPWDWLAAKTEQYASVGTATRCKVCGLSIRGPLGFVNRAVWGVTPLSKHPDLCNV